MSWPEKEQFPPWLFQEAPVTSWYLLPALTSIIAVILLVWGATLVVLSYRTVIRLGPCRSRWWLHDRVIDICTGYRVRFRDPLQRIIPANFEFWLGSWLIADAMLYGLLAATTFRAHQGIEVWILLFFILVSIPAVVAFGYWVRDRMPQ
jgi:hypothetical protein